MVGYPEMPHLSRRLQQIKSLRHLLRLHKGIRPVQEQNVQIFCLKTLQNPIHRFQDMFFGAVIHHAGHNAAFGLENNPVPQCRVLMQVFPEHLLTFSRPVDIGMVKKYGAHIHSLCNIVIRFLLLQIPHAHTANCHRWNLQAAFSQIYCLHYCPPI